MTHISDPHFAERVRASFDRQNAMALIQAALPLIEHGRTETRLPLWPGHAWEKRALNSSSLATPLLTTNN